MRAPEPPVLGGVGALAILIGAGLDSGLLILVGLVMVAAAVILVVTRSAR